MPRNYATVIVFLSLLFSSFTPSYAFSFFGKNLLPSFAGKSTQTIPNNCHILILPGFGNAKTDYTMEKSIVSSLLNRGWSERQVSVLPMERSDWLQVFTRGIFDLKFWTGDAAPTRAAFRWYLDRIADEIKRIENEWRIIRGDDNSDAKIILVGHSAGGWLGRAAAGYGSCGDEVSEKDDFNINLNRIIGIVTLGAPNIEPPPGVMDMTRGALRITNENFPGAYHSPSLFYVTAIGNAVKGKEQIRQSFLEPTTQDGFAFNSYLGVCGDGCTLGDGVVPISSAHLDGAIQLELDEVYHSINKPEQWYGSDDIIDQWLEVVKQELSKKM